MRARVAVDASKERVCSVPCASSSLQITCQVPVSPSATSPGPTLSQVTGDSGSDRRLKYPAICERPEVTPSWRLEAAAEIEPEAVDALSVGCVRPAGGIGTVVNPAGCVRGLRAGDSEWLLRGVLVPVGVVRKRGGCPGILPAEGRSPCEPNRLSHHVPPFPDTRTGWRRLLSAARDSCPCKHGSVTLCCWREQVDWAAFSMEQLCSGQAGCP